MHFALNYVIPAIIINFIPALIFLASPVIGASPTSEREATSISYKNITRTINGKAVLFPLTSCTEPVELDCIGWCLSIPVNGDIQSDCETDCDDDYCVFGTTKIEFPENSGLFVEPSELIVLAREQKLTALHAKYHATVTNSHLQRRDLVGCLASCRTFAQFAGYIPYRVARAFASGLAHTACPAICYATFT